MRQSSNTLIWAVHKFERTVLSMESDILKGAKFTESLTLAAGPSDVGEGSTRPRRIHIGNRSLRGCCDNAVVVSLRTLTEHSHYRLVSTLLELDKELQDYHTDQNRDSRSVPNNVKWITKQCGGGFISHLNKFLNCLFDVQKQMKAGLQMPGCDGSVLPRGAITDLERQDMELENEYAAVYGDGAFAFMVARTERNLWMVGWPFRFFGCIDGSVEFIESTLRASNATWISARSSRHLMRNRRKWLRYRIVTCFFFLRASGTSLLFKSWASTVSMVIFALLRKRQLRRMFLHRSSRTSTENKLCLAARGKARGSGNQRHAWRKLFMLKWLTSGTSTRMLLWIHRSPPLRRRCRIQHSL